MQTSHEYSFRALLTAVCTGPIVLALGSDFLSIKTPNNNRCVLRLPRRKLGLVAKIVKRRACLLEFGFPISLLPLNIRV